MPVLTQLDGAIASVVIDNQQALNAVSPEIMDGLHAALDEVEAAGARVCIVSGAGGRAFSAGADLAAMLEFTREYAREQLEAGMRLTRRLETGPFVSVAAVDGWALGGGGEIVLACDLRIASRSAKFGLPEVTVGIFAGWGGAVRLPRQAPLPVALDVLLSGRILDAEEALRAGIFGEVVDDPLAAARATAERLLKAGPEAQLLCRAVARETRSLDLEAALEHSIERWLPLMESAERVEGHRAFVEKRPAWWTHEP